MVGARSPGTMVTMDGDLVVLEPTEVPVLRGLESQAALFEDTELMLTLDQESFGNLVALVVDAGKPLIAAIRRHAGLVAWAAWHRYNDKQCREFYEGMAERLGIKVATLRDWRDATVEHQGLSIPILAQTRSDAAKKGALEAASRRELPGQTPGAGINPAFSAPIPTSSAEATQIPGEHATAGSGLALAGSPGTSSEGGGSDGETRPAPLSEPRSGQALEGVVPSLASGPAPSGPNSTERPPSDRQLAHRVVAAMRDVDPEDAGQRLTPDEATFIGQWTGRALHTWRTQAVASPPAPPTRQSGYVIRPEDREAAATLAAAQTAAAAPVPRPSPMASVRASLAGEVGTIRPADCGHPIGQPLGDTCMACSKTL